MDYNTNISLNYETLTIIIAIILGLFLFLSFFINFYLPFKGKRDYIIMEIKRSFEEEEYRYWKRELKHLYLSSIPLIGIFFK